VPKAAGLHSGVQGMRVSLARQKILKSKIEGLVHSEQASRHRCSPA
jgi:hypothetical protein